MIWGSGGSKSRLAKAAGAEPAGQMRDEKLHAVVARSTFPSQNVQNTPASDHFWKLRCRKSARRCGAKHICKSKCTKHTHCRTTFGSCDVEKVHVVVARSTFPSQNVQNTPLSDHFWKFTMSKKCTPLWREAHFQVKMYKTHQLRTTFGSCDVEKVHAVVARSTFPSQNVQSTTCSRHFWRFGCRKSARRCGAKHISKSKCIKHTIVRDHFWRFGCRKSARRCGAKHISLSQNIHYTTSWSYHFWKLRCRKSTRRCGAKHISKSKYTKHHTTFATTFGSCHVEKVHAVMARSTFPSQNVYKAPQVRTTFGDSDVEKVHVVIRCETHFEVKMHKTARGSRPLLEVRMSR